MIGAVPPVRTKALARGEALFRQGDAKTGVFEVTLGRLRLERRTFDGRLVVLHTARAGELFAEASLFADAYHCDAVAITDAVVDVYDKAALLADLAPRARKTALSPPWPVTCRRLGPAWSSATCARPGSASCSGWICGPVPPGR